MESIKRAALACLVFFSAFSLHAQVSNPDTMVRKLFATLPANDENGFVALYPSPQQMMELVKNIMSSDEVKQQMALSGQGNGINMDSLIQTQIALMAKPEMMAEMKKGFGKNFQRTIEKGKAKNIDWKKTRFVSWTPDTAASASGQDEAMLQKLGYKTLNGVIDFSVDTSTYQMQFSKIIFIPKENGWYGGEFGQIVRKGQSFAPEDLETKEVDVSTTRDVTPPPAPPPKSKTKTKTADTKTKTKTTAKKPTTKS